MASRNPDDLHVDMQPRFRAAVKAWALAGLDVLVTCTYRSNAEQAQLYMQGRTLPGHIVTNARPGESAHNYVTADGTPAALAFDVVPLKNGKPDWGTTGADLDLWQRVADLAKPCGLNWYGEPDAPFREFPHFQHPLARAIIMAGAA